MRLRFLPAVLAAAALPLGGPLLAQLNFPDITYDAVDILKTPPNIHLGEAAEAEGHPLRAREVLLDRMIEQAIERRGAFNVPMFDPVIIRLQAEYEPFQQFIERLYAALLGTEAGVEARLHAAMLSSAISVAVMHPLLADVDGETLRAQLKEMTRRMLNLPASACRGR